MEKESIQFFRRLKQNVSAYVELRLDLLKLEAYGRIANVIAVLSHGVVLLLLAFFAILFLFLALGFFLGELLGTVSLGFVIVAGLYILLLLIILLCRHVIRQKVSDIVIAAMMTKDEQDDEKEEDNTL